MAKTEFTVPIRVDTSALHHQLDHLGRTFQGVADAYFQAAQKVLEDASPEPELDTSDLSDPEPTRNYCGDPECRCGPSTMDDLRAYAESNPEGWGDLLRSGTFADEPAHDERNDDDHGLDLEGRCEACDREPTPNEIHGSYGDEPVVIDECGEVLSIEKDSEGWIIACTQEPGHIGPHAGPISWFDDGWDLTDPDEGWLAAICPHGLVTGGAGYRTFEERLKAGEMLEGTGRHLVEYPVGPTIQLCSKCLTEDVGRML